MSFGSVMGSLWVSYGITLGQLWDHFGSVMGSLWVSLHFGIPKLVLARFWPPFVFLLAHLIWPKLGPCVIPKLCQNGMQVLGHKIFATSYILKGASNATT
jgi:hypothetical protein